MPRRLDPLNLRALMAEFIGTAFLVMVVVGSGIMAKSLSPENDAVALIGNTLATAAGLSVLILLFTPLSGAYFNPVVSLAFYLRRELSLVRFLAYISVQLGGGVVGVILAHAMFELPLLQTGTHIRTGYGVWIGELVATSGLLLVILGCITNKNEKSIPYAVALFIAAGYWFTSSTSFANPAVTLARSLTDTFSGIRPEDIAGFVSAQITACFLTVFFAKWLWKYIS